MRKKLITLEENNNIAFNKTTIIALPNGVACPNCGEELVDTNPMVTLTSQPAQKQTNCTHCGYTGTRFI